MDEMTKLKQWYVADLRKPGIDPFERAAVLRSLLNDLNVSVREYSRQEGIPRSTLDDWLLHSKLSEDQYQKLLAAGMTPTMIYRALRKDKAEERLVVEIDVFLLEVQRKVRKYKRLVEFTHKTTHLIEETVNELNKLHVEINLKEKKEAGR